jgi:RNA polymerase sigma factor (sigma-70 family)
MNEPEQNRPCASRPLESGKYYREADVERQIRELNGVSTRELLRLAQQSDHTAPDFIKEETLVYFLREAMRSQNPYLASDLHEILTRRAAGKIRRLVSVRKMLSEQRTQDCEYDIYSQMAQCLFEVTTATEFWEVHFWQSLQRLTNNIASRYQTAEWREIHPKVFEDGEEDERDFLDEASTVDFQSIENQNFIQQAICVLPEHERQVFLLTHQYQWNQTQIADKMGVTDRTVRTWLRSAERRLGEWCRTQELHRDYAR